MAVHPIQNNFAFGELSPRLHGRSNTERYQGSLALCRDVVTFSHGMASKRWGTRMITASPTEGDARFIRLQNDIRHPWVAEFGWRSATGGYVRVLDRYGYVTGGVQYLANACLAGGLQGWKNASATPAAVEWVEPGYALFRPATVSATPYASILRQQVTGAGAAVLHRLTTHFYADTSSDALEIRVGTAEGLSDILSATHGSGAVASTFTPGVASFWVELRVAGSWDGSTLGLDAVFLTEDADTTWEAATPYGNDDLELLAFAAATNELALYLVTQGHPPQKLSISAAGAVTFAAISFTSTPAAWGAGDYPGAAAIFKRRLWLAGSPSKPDTLWASKVGDFTDMGLGTGTATDAIEFEMASDGAIQWLAAAKNLLVGLDVGEHIITSDGGVVIPGDIRADEQSGYGSARQVAQKIGNGVLYVGSDARRIRFLAYQFLEEGWVSTDITWPSEHVTENGIRELHFVYGPDPFLWIVRRDGVVVSAVYEREQNNLVGWHVHSIGGALTGCLTKLGAANELWLAVRRGGTVYVERTEARTGYATADGSEPVPLGFYTDASVVRAVKSDDLGLYVDGLSHLEGSDVQVMVGNATHPDRTVESAAIRLQSGFATVGDIARVGLGYTGIMKTLPLEGVIQGGTSMSAKKRQHRIYARLLNSWMPSINGIATEYRRPATPMDEPEPLITDDIDAGNLGLDRYAQTTIEMPRPLPYNVLALFSDSSGSAL